MNIETTVNATTATLKLIGRLDTTGAPALDAELDNCLKGATELVLDLEELSYISSAGLRVLLKAQKVMKTQGSMKLIHVGEGIMEVFDITGFVDILTIE